MKNPAGETDERLLIEAAQKDPERFAELYEDHFDRVYAFVIRRVRNRAQAQDVTSEVFHHALANLDRFEWRGAPFSAWLFRIAANAIIDHSRRGFREESLMETQEPSATDAEIEEAGRSSNLFRCVERLSPDQRRVILMRFGEEKSIREIAQHLSRTEGAVKQLQLRGLQRLRTLMEQSNG